MDNELKDIMFPSEEHNVSMIGETCDRIFDREGNLIKEIHDHNIVVNSFIKLVMNLLKNQPNFKGIQYWAVGSGDSSWDESLPNPDKDATRLNDEIGRMEILPENINFLTPELEITTVPTNKLQVFHSFGYNDCNGIWREFGIFGGNATEEANSGIMINKRHHEIITKTTDMIVERTLRFTFNLV